MGEMKNASQGKQPGLALEGRGCSEGRRRPALLCEHRMPVPGLAAPWHPGTAPLGEQRAGSPPFACELVQGPLYPTGTAQQPISVLIDSTMENQLTPQNGGKGYRMILF